MSALQAKIDSLEAEIEGYRNDLSVATTPEDRRMYGGLITERGKTLNTLLTQQQQQQQQQQQGGKFYIHIVTLCVYWCVGVYLLVISWCISERLQRQWGVYHNILHLFVIQQVVDVFELKCVLKTFCGCLRLVSFHMYLTNTQLLSSLCLASLHFPLHITGNVTASSTQGKHSLFSRSSLLFVLFSLL